MTDSASLAVELDAVTKIYRGDLGSLSALAGVSLKVPNGQFVVVRGHAGSGKSTLLRLVAGIERANSGRLLVLGNDFRRLHTRAIDLLRRQHIGVTLQSALLIKHLNVESNVALPLLISGNHVSEAREAVSKLLEALRIGHLARTDSHHLSRGEAKRVAIARMLIHRPRLVLADEPTIDLDRQSVPDVVQLIRSTARESDRATLVFSNDPDVTVFADRIVELRCGQLHGDTGQIIGIRSASHVA